MKKVVSVRFREDTIDAVRRRAKRLNRNVSNYIETLVEKDLAGGADAQALRSSVRSRLAGILKALQEHRAELRQMGVRHLSIFGSVARGEEGPDSDIDILVEVDPAIVNSIFAYGGIQQSVEEWLRQPVDLADKNRLRPGVAEAAERDRILVF